MANFLVTIALFDFQTRNYKSVKVECSATIGFTNKSDYTPRRHSSHKFNCCRFFILFFETSSAEGK
nr:unnamed protein product [Callosobruchus analis]